MNDATKFHAILEAPYLARTFYLALPDTLADKRLYFSMILKSNSD